MRKKNKNKNKNKKLQESQNLNTFVWKLLVFMSADNIIVHFRYIKILTWLRDLGE